ncbi:hypothetical protein, conserved [Eimeria tenella]|uniref:F-box domain-containing protein n=1 Tax=Eimeria tenella TaxID=5802 RepID=U6L7L0_EIMTE|nr:hypothetical protein, conserved [Eimeria tenella]CDJ44544.1 hypothetical protein, conserved [Eimeria tenella]|eukprot:XP_013235292.1 hypothetical protein, conserved [Eimeria tenella]
MIEEKKEISTSQAAAAGTSAAPVCGAAAAAHPPLLDAAEPATAAAPAAAAATTAAAAAAAAKGGPKQQQGLSPLHGHLLSRVLWLSSSSPKEKLQCSLVCKDWGAALAAPAAAWSPTAASSSSSSRAKALPLQGHLLLQVLGLAEETQQQQQRLKLVCKDWKEALALPAAWLDTRESLQPAEPARTRRMEERLAVYFAALKQQSDDLLQQRKYK